MHQASAPERSALPAAYDDRRAARLPASRRRRAPNDSGRYLELLHSATEYDPFSYPEAALVVSRPAIQRISELSAAQYEIVDGWVRLRITPTTSRGVRSATAGLRVSSPQTALFLATQRFYSRA